MAVGFWDSFFDSDYRQRSDINEMRDTAFYVANDLETLRGACGTLQRQVHDLSVLVTVLVRILEESGQVDTKVLRYRVEAELDAIAAARGLAPAPVTTSGSPAHEPAPTVPTRCTKCGQTVPANRTTITELGVVCDVCAAK